MTVNLRAMEGLIIDVVLASIPIFVGVGSIGCI